MEIEQNFSEVIEQNSPEVEQNFSEVEQNSPEVIEQNSPIKIFWYFVLNKVLLIILLLERR